MKINNKSTAFCFVLVFMTISIHCRLLISRWGGGERRYIFFYMITVAVGVYMINLYGGWLFVFALAQRVAKGHACFDGERSLPKGVS